VLAQMCCVHDWTAPWYDALRHLPALLSCSCDSYTQAVSSLWNDISIKLCEAGSVLRQLFIAQLKFQPLGEVA
jgi:hypothetical protein